MLARHRVLSICKIDGENRSCSSDQRQVCEKWTLTKVSKGPVFVPLDTPQADGTPLTEKALWREVVPIDRLPPHSPDNSLQEFRQRVHREFARLTGLSEAEVEVEFRIVPLHR